MGGEGRRHSGMEEIREVGGRRGTHVCREMGGLGLGEATGMTWVGIEGGGNSRLMISIDIE